MFQFHWYDDVPTAYRWFAVAALILAERIVVTVNGAASGSTIPMLVAVIGLSMFPFDDEVRLVSGIGARS